jgi:uncharacterized protein YdhG (YjbR/CyaY superfamily)
MILNCGCGYGYQPLYCSRNLKPLNSYKVNVRLAIELFVDMVELTRMLSHIVSDSETLSVEFASSEI